jgi:hypothetical protein
LVTGEQAGQVIDRELGRCASGSFNVGGGLFGGGLFNVMVDAR